MQVRFMLTVALAAVVPFGPALAQGMVMIPTGNNAAPVPQNPPADPKDTPEEIAKDAARDLKDTRFYNRPGATRADYDRDWQECRLIARGSRTPTGMIPYYYNPAVVSPLAAGIGGGIGGLIGAAIVEGEQRRANRRQCLLIKGWRLVEVPSADAVTVTAMTPEQRSTYFDGVVGATDVKGDVTERRAFALDRAALGLDLDKPVSGTGKVFAGKKVDPAVSVVPGEGEAVLVLSFRRPDAASAGRSALVNLVRYDVAGRDRVYQPRDWKKKGDKTTYSVMAKSFDKTSAYETQVLRVTAGAYVIDNHAAGTVVPMSSYCFGAPVVEARAGDVIYLGDFVPLIGAPTKQGSKFTGVAWTSNVDDARRTLATAQPGLAAKMVKADWRNHATYACAAQMMDRWDLPGVEELPAPAPASTAPSSTVVPLTK